jgi:acetyl-CoA decarbonylase/synthase complex subunit beta
VVLILPTLLGDLIKRAPDGIEGFRGSEYPLPIILALRGKVPGPSLLREDAGKYSNIDLAGSPKEKEIEGLLYSALSLAEAIESACDDKDDFFITDSRFRSQVFSVKRSPGWALVLGDEDQSELIEGLAKKRFTIFSTFKHPKAQYLGCRDTSSIYFLQNLVRYAIIYGGISPGDPPGMSHFLEDDGPGIVIVHGRQRGIEPLLTLGYMLMGAPAIVPSSFPYVYGNRAIADSMDEILEESMKFPNLRIIEHEGERYQLPAYCNPANLRKRIKVARTLGNTERSFFVVRRAHVADGIQIIGGMGKDMGIIIELNYEGMNEFAAEFLEQIAATFPNYIKGVTSSIFADYIKGATKAPGGHLRLGLAPRVKLTGEMVAQTIHDGLKKQYPRLGNVKVTVIFDVELLKEKKPEIIGHMLERAKAIAAVNEETMTEFYSCVGCQPFARGHTCIVTPERQPQCSRDWRLMLVGSRLNPEDIPDPLSRRGRRTSANAFGVLHKGRAIDPLRGEWRGINEGVRHESGGKIQRVQLHSITGGYPHSSCGCFGYLAFYMREVDGIGIMRRGFMGKAPNGMTWDLLANMAGGKQQSGICGVSLNYLRSPKFLQGDGGYERVVWMDRKTYAELANLVDEQRIATENDVKDMEQLREFMAKKFFK